ncbi:MAG: metal-dependent hydrolase [Candidatus Korobacteraceae bacterium]
MDPLTHFLTGACMGRSGFNRKTALATVTMVLAAEAADVDVLWEFKGSIAGLQHHRGITHSFVGVPFVAAAVLGFVYIVHRFLARRRLAKATPASPPADPSPSQDSHPQTTKPAKPRVRWGFLYFCAVLAALSHLLLDYTTAYGIRLFEPFSFRWYSWDIVYIIDPLIWLVLVAGLAVPALFSLINQEIGARSKGPRGRGGAIAALVCLVLIWGVRDYQHRRALEAMNAFLYHRAQPLRLAAYPYMLSPLRWHGVVEATDFFETVPVNSQAPSVDDEAGRLYYKPPETSVSRAAKASYFGRVYLDWAAFPYALERKLDGDSSGYLVEFEDLRYAYPPTSQRAPLSGFVLLDRQLRVMQEGMNSNRSPSVETLERAPENR